MTKQWPEDGSPVSVDEITSSICNAITWAYNLERQNKNDNIPYSGLPLNEMKSSEFGSDIEQRMSKEYIAQMAKIANKTPLHILVECAILLGIEQGRRLEKIEI